MLLDAPVLTPCSQLLPTLCSKDILLPKTLGQTCHPSSCFWHQTIAIPGTQGFFLARVLHLVHKAFFWLVFCRPLGQT